MNPNQVTPTLCFLFACLMLMCLAACSDSDKAAVATAGAVNDTAERQRMGDFYAPSPTPKECPRHLDHTLADPHHHNEFRSEFGAEPTDWAQRVIAEEDEAYRKCMEGKQ